MVYHHVSSLNNKRLESLLIPKGTQV
jgi:hypothetical protein